MFVEWTNDGSESNFKLWNDAPIITSSLRCVIPYSIFNVLFTKDNNRNPFMFLPSTGFRMLSSYWWILAFALFSAKGEAFSVEKSILWMLAFLLLPLYRILLTFWITSYKKKCFCFKPWWTIHLPNHHRQISSSASGNIASLFLLLSPREMAVSPRPTPLLTILAPAHAHPTGPHVQLLFGHTALLANLEWHSAPAPSLPSAWITIPALFPFYCGQ